MYNFRILELKQELQKLEVSEYHFGVNGLVDYKLTPDDKQLAEIPDITERPEGLQKMLEHIFDQVKERKRQLGIISSLDIRIIYHI